MIALKPKSEKETLTSIKPKFISVGQVFYIYVI